MMLNGNKGTRYLFTLDGLFVQELFGDMRVHPVMQNLPEAVRGMVLSRNSLSDECFYGWFGDVGGKPHLIVGKDSLNVCELRGAGSLARLPGGALTLREEAPPLAQTPRAARGPMRTVKAISPWLSRRFISLSLVSSTLRKPRAFSTSLYSG